MNVLLQKSRKYFFPRSVISIYYDIILSYNRIFLRTLYTISLSLNIYEVHTKIIYYEVYIIRMILFFKLSLKRSLKLMPFFFF